MVVSLTALPAVAQPAREDEAEDEPAAPEPAQAPSPAAADEVGADVNAQAAAGPSEPNALLPRLIEDGDGGPQGAFPSRPPSGRPRGTNVTASVGPGFLALDDAIGRDGQGATGLMARIGMVPVPEWNLFVAVEHTTTDRDGATFAQTAGLLGAQRFFMHRLYLGAGVGLAGVAQTGVEDGISNGPGLTLSAHLGVEAIRWSHVALTAELSFTRASYEREAWEMGGLRIGLVVF